MPPPKQSPIAIVGLACRLPGNCNSPEDFWQFLLDGKIADTDPPKSRFDIKGHYDGTGRQWTMRSPGGMFINADPRDLDAEFFGLSHSDATSMDPQQRQLLEVVCEGLENAGLTMESLKSRSYGCFVGSYASDYSDIQMRDPEDRTPSFTVGSGRAMLSNRISHFLDIKGPSMTIDTACSGSLTSLDVACRYINSGDSEGAIVAGCNLYLSPEHNMDQSAMISAASPTGRCWTFDARADGYIKAEAVNAIILKPLEDALRDGDPIRAIIRGTSVNSDGWTPGIASPNADAQVWAIKRAYERAGITNIGDTAYLECHGTGTLAGDPIECRAASTVFSPFRTGDNPLRIGSVKSNIGHSEPAAGISGVLKAVLACENGVIPGNPTFKIPNPQINFQEAKLLPSNANAQWPRGMIRRAGVNSFGYGGSNAHVVVEHPDVLLPGRQPTHVSSYSRPALDLLDDDDDEGDNEERHLLVFSANDETSLKSYIRQVIRHLANPAVYIKMADLARTLGERRTRHFHRAYVISDGVTFKEHQAVFGTPGTANRIGFVFTGQGAQWPRMGRKLIKDFPIAKTTIQNLDRALQSMSNAPSWGLLEELTQPRSDEHYRRPEFSQPLVTALQLALIELLRHWNIEPVAVVGHSSGEIAAAVAAGLLSQEEGIQVAYLRGKAATDVQEQRRPFAGETLSVNQGPPASPPEGKTYGMLAVGLGQDDVALRCLDGFSTVSVACLNSPKSVTLSGETGELEKVQQILQGENHFVRMLKVDLAYHSKHMEDIAARYQELLLEHCVELGREKSSGTVRFFSTVHGAVNNTACDVGYWVANMVSPVRFSDGAAALIRDGIDHLVEIGPSPALGGPIKQIIEYMGGASPVNYSGTISRTDDSTGSLYSLAGKLVLNGVDINTNQVNVIDQTSSRIIVDLPRYQWNHSVKYWHESLASKDWRYRPFPVHDLLGTKVLGTSWHAPTWKRILRLGNVPWIKDHVLGTDVVFPGAGYLAMAVEAKYQHAKSTRPEQFPHLDSVRKASYRLRDVRLLRALVIEEGVDHHIYLFLSSVPGQTDSWSHFKISSFRDGIWTHHCTGLIRIDPSTPPKSSAILPLRHATSITPWNKSMQQVGFRFGPLFQNVIDIEYIPGQRTSRARLNLVSKTPALSESNYVVHPTILDSFLQSCLPSLYQGCRTSINTVLVPNLIDEITFNIPEETSSSGIASTRAVFLTGRKDKSLNYAAEISIHDEILGLELCSIKGLRFSELDIPKGNADDKPTFMKLDWKPDVSLLRHGDNIQLETISVESETELLDMLLLPWQAAKAFSLVLHKLPNPAVLDLDMSEAKDDEQSHENNEESSSLKQLQLRRYVHASKVTSNMTKAQTRLHQLPVAEFFLYDITSNTAPRAPFPVDEGFELVIIRLSRSSDSGTEIAVVSKNVRELLRPGGFLIILQEQQPCTRESEFLESTAFTLLVNTPLDTAGSVQLYSYTEHTASKAEEALNFTMVRLSDDTNQLQSLTSAFESRGWQGSVITVSEVANLPSDSTLLVVDDFRSPWLLRMAEAEWRHLHTIMSPKRSVLWLTSGSQMHVSSPSHALVQGLARTIRGEDPTLTLKTLDVRYLDDSYVPSMVIRVMECIKSPLQGLENEYCEHDGVLNISRVRLDNRMRRIAREMRRGSGPPVTEMWLRKNPKTVRMHCERIGAMDSLQFNQVEEEDDLPPGHVEVEMEAAGLNYKDIANTLGIVPENEYLLGHEGAGVIVRVGSDVHSYRKGDRVAVHSRGSFANRVRLPKEGVFLIPDWVSFEEAATMSIVYFTVVYGLMDIAKLKAGQSILIHSATGGVGIACLQVCRYLGVNVYATVGSDVKKRFLQEQYGIPAENIFSSRTSEFADGIRSLTQGKGVDCVLNFLTGDLLEESWRLLADNGIMVEIGKKDIIDRNTISMQPLDRNCTYRGIDISQQTFLDDLQLVERVLQTIRELLVNGNIKPISPMTVFSFAEIPDAMRYMRSGEHLGKIVISYGKADDVKVPVRESPRVLRLSSDDAYLIVGGLKGLCGSLAEFLVRCGARYLVSFSRSGRIPETSNIIYKLESMGAKVEVLTGDVTKLSDVLRIFQDPARPIAGVIQGAMVLKDKTFESMTVDDYHAAMQCKVTGTWNLHKAALESGRNLSFFTMLSSISGVLGTAGQANYAAGNTFQDAFASYRRSLGLRAHTIDLGIIEDVGYMSERQDLTDRAQRRGNLIGIDEAQLHEMIKLSILQQTTDTGVGMKSEQMITGLPWPLSEDSPLLKDGRFGTLVAPHHSKPVKLKSNDGIETFMTMVAAKVPEGELVDEVVKLAGRQIVQMLGLRSVMEESKALTSYGIDSLAAVDLRNWFNTYMGIPLTTLDILGAGTLRLLCTKAVRVYLDVPA